MALRGIRSLALLACCCFSCAAFAQDTRTVTEPRMPPVCVTLTAQLTAHGVALAEADESKLDTARIQQAMDQCGPGHSVLLAAEIGGANAFLSGPLELRAGVTLVVGHGTTLFASRDPRLFDVTPGGCGIVTKGGAHGCRDFIHGKNVPGAGIMGDPYTRAAGSTAPPLRGTIDGRGGMKLLGQNISWWDLAQQAKAQNAGQQCPRLIHIEDSDNFTLYNITLRNAPNFHVLYSHGNGFTAWGVIIDTPATARNTDGIDPASSTNVTITHCFIHAGDDNVAIKAGSDGPATHMTIAHNHFYSGHGMSIGSETNGGASAIRVTDLSIDGADNGLRIKSNSSRGGLVQDVIYDDVCIRDTKNPIYMDTHYSFFGADRDKIPVFQGIVLRNVAIMGAGKITLDGFDAAHRLKMTFDGVTLDPVSGFQIEAGHADLTFGPGPVNFSPTGDDVHVAGNASSNGTHSCAEKFVPMPAH
ncbi:MAG: glycosyl hydrolase family 28 protein [Candidatus Acidiferrales bacterium]